EVPEAAVKAAGNDGRETAGFEFHRHADYAFPRKSTELISSLRHRIERVRDHNQDAIRGVLHHFAHYGLHDPVIRVEQIVAAHAGLARDAGGNDDDVGIRRIFVVVRATDVGVTFFDRHRLKQVEALPLWHTLDYVDQDDVRQFLGRDPVRRSRAHVA